MFTGPDAVVLHTGVNVSPGNLQRPVAPPGSSLENVFNSLACDPGHSAAAVLVGLGSERPWGVLEGSSLVTNSSAGLNYPCCWADPRPSDGCMDMLPSGWGPALSGGLITAWDSGSLPRKDKTPVDAPPAPSHTGPGPPLRKQIPQHAYSLPRLADRGREKHCWWYLDLFQFFSFPLTWVLNQCPVF